VWPYFKPGTSTSYVLCECRVPHRLASRLPSFRHLSRCRSRRSRGRGQALDVCSTMELCVAILQTMYVYFLAQFHRSSFHFLAGYPHFDIYPIASTSATKNPVNSLTTYPTFNLCTSLFLETSSCFDHCLDPAIYPHNLDEIYPTVVSDGDAHCISDSVIYLINIFSITAVSPRNSKWWENAI